MFLKLEVIKKIYGLAILCITVFCFKSPLAIAMGSAFTTLISCFVNASPNKKLLNYSYAEQMKDIIPAMALSVVMGALVYCISFIGLTNWFTLIIQIVAGIVIYITGAKLFHIESFEYILSIIKEIIGKKTKRGV